MNSPRLIVVGGSGLIGRAVMKAASEARLQAIGTGLTRHAHPLLMFDMSSSDLGTVIPDLCPDDFVILLAGYISPTWIFDNAAAGRHLNYDRSKRLVDEVRRSGARLLFVSTDQVFDGVIGGYSELAEPNPVNLYGQLKAAMESYVLENEDNIVVRTGWNVGWFPSVHCPVYQCYTTLLKPNAKMAYDNIINVTDVDDTANGIVRLCFTRSSVRLCHLVSQPGISREGLAKIIKSQSIYHNRMHYQPVPFSSIIYNEPRPVRAFLGNEKARHLGLKFSGPEDVIARKVKLLDQWPNEVRDQDALAQSSLK